MTDPEFNRNTVARDAGHNDSLQDQLKQHAMDLVMHGTTWLTADDVSTGMRSEGLKTGLTVDGLLAERRVFAIEGAHGLLFPAYAFDAHGQPLPAMKRILEALKDCSASSIASWFESTSSQLGGKRPREMLKSDPDAVVVAAQAFVVGPEHG